MVTDRVDEGPGRLGPDEDFRPYRLSATGHVQLMTTAVWGMAVVAARS